MPRIDKIASGRRLRELRFHLRELLGINEKEIAKLIGVHESTIRRYEERGGVKKLLPLLCRLFLEQILTGSCMARERCS